ncbi:MAG TPA: isoprenylcysteine carboxylmethyltransferase family protein [Fimbriimonadaceae bacterium]|nr:isoprenylcysteine carboxylmethyltransferase family protein [Fimbriimonadaceae bacterium]
MDTRERRLVIAYCVITILATIAWWIGLATVPEVKVRTLGSAFAVDFRVLLLADLFSAGLLPALILATMRFRPAALFWAHLGGQGYAFLVSVGGAIADPTAYFGVVAMLASAGASLAFAIRFANLHLLWGPFRFRHASTTSQASAWHKTLMQTAGMWLVFLLLIPLAAIALEDALGWQQSPWGQPFQAVALLVFVAAGGVGLYSGWVMTRDGKGTPLPSEGARQLVITGPYRVIRNPMALLGVLQGIAVGVILSSPLVMVYAALGAVFWEVLVRPLEETYLESQFGDEYREYQKQVRCWLPVRSKR